MTGYEPWPRFDQTGTTTYLNQFGRKRQQVTTLSPTIRSTVSRDGTSTAAQAAETISQRAAGLCARSTCRCAGFLKFKLYIRLHARLLTKLTGGKTKNKIKWIKKQMFLLASSHGDLVVIVSSAATTAVYEMQVQDYTIANVAAGNIFSHTLHVRYDAHRYYTDQVETKFEKYGETKIKKKTKIIIFAV